MSGEHVRDNELYERIVRTMSTEIWGKVFDAQREAKRYTESPIEALFLEALLTENDLYVFGDLFDGKPYIIASIGDCMLRTEPRPFADGDRCLIISPQQAFGPYRVDFALIWGGTGRRLIVECDGHEFHERSKEQAQRDKARDRHIVSCGWPVMRFTGSELFADPYKCSKQVVDFLTEPTPEQVRELDAVIAKSMALKPEAVQ